MHNGDKSGEQVTVWNDLSCKGGVEKGLTVIGDRLKIDFLNQQNSTNIGLNLYAGDGRSLLQ